MIDLAKMAEKATSVWSRDTEIVGFFQFEPHLAKVLVRAQGVDEVEFIISNYNANDNAFFSSVYNLNADNAPQKFAEHIRRAAGYFDAWERRRTMAPTD